MKYTIADLSLFAANKEGTCLSTSYSGIKVKYIWKCNDTNHASWLATWDNIRQGKWCPKCGHQASAESNRYAIEDLRNIAINKKGLCLSSSYSNSKTKYIWQCKDGHIWKATADHIIHDTWCPTCAGHEKPTIDSLQEIAKTNSGILLSSIYKSAHSKLKWQCSKGHVWLASRADVKRGSWCPECSTCKTEYRCKELLELLTGLTFKKTRFIYNSNRYEFDGYNKETNTAFEYQGIQHYVYPNYFHKTKEVFEAAKQRDRDKEQYCIENNINLIVIPYTVKNKQLKLYISELVGYNGES